jgi:hypothetical protein
MPHGKANVADGLLDPAMASDVASFFLQHTNVTELAFRGEPGVGFNHTACHQSLGRALQVKLHFRAHLPVDCAASEEGSKSSAQEKEHRGLSHPAERNVPPRGTRVGEANTDVN